MRKDVEVASVAGFKAHRLAVLASHEGTTLQAILDATEEMSLVAQVCLVLSNNGDSAALRRARAKEIPAIHLSSKHHSDAGELDLAICKSLLSHRPDLVVLAGYMKKLGPITLCKFRGRIVNTHPALLPKYGGKGMFGSRVHAAVIAAGESETGVSVHLVETEYDSGPVIAQCRVPVLPTDGVEILAQRVQECERQFLVETLRKITSGQLPLVST